MPQATFHFPRGFLWGTATASHQVEGNNTNNNWWAWEQEPGRIIHSHKSGAACDCAPELISSLSDFLGP